jgi:signal transduction histidine kinase/CheY-like chemotaxis protein
MPERFHSLLRRQLKRCFGGVERVPEECRPFVEAVNDAYRQADVDRVMLERSLELSSEELGEANARLRQAILELQAAHGDLERRVAARTDALEAAHERLRHAQKMEVVGQLAGGIAHDFNNLLTVILGSAELLLESGARDRFESGLEDIHNAAQRAAALTQGLLAFSRRQVLAPRVVDLNAVLHAIQKMLTRVIREDIALHVEPAAAPAWVRIDPHQIEQVVLNLVVNARDALPDGGRIRLEVENGPWVTLRVADNGVGMTPDVQERIFEPFFTTKEVGKGTGLGLASVYGIVHQSNGSIRVESAPGAGTTFTLSFATAEAGANGDGHVAPMPAAVPDRDVILLVEDEHAVRDVIREMLQRLGYEVLEATTPFEACAIFDRRANDIRLLVSDIVMPGMNGPALAQRLVAREPNLRVLFISGYADIDPGIPFGHTIRFMPKPILGAELARNVRELIARN